MGTVFYASWAITSFAAVLHLLLVKRDPSATLAWLFFVVTIPIIGPCIFIVMGPQRVERGAIKRKQELEKNLGHTIFLTHAASPPPGELRSSDQQVLELARRISNYEATQGNRVALFPDPEDVLKAMQDEIARAKDFIHLEYYIIQSDEITHQLFESLQKAVKRGVQVRILYDALGSLFLKKIYFSGLVDIGAKAAGFLPMTFLPHRLHLNFRNHRKILIIDGRVAFTGGTNIGKEYLGAPLEGRWHDYSIRVEGPACHQLQDVFAKDWFFTTQEDLFFTRYYPAVSPFDDGAKIQVLESGPDSTFQALHQAIFLAINEARERIFLTTPYFVPDPAIISALQVAALRGVAVHILLPSKNDSRIVQFASRSFYDDLLSSGVRIYEFQPRILHAKLLTIDGKWTMFGSANMDIRSFKLNFELNVLVYGTSVSKQAETMFQNDLQNSVEILPDVFSKRSIATQLAENACRLLSPLL